VVNIRRRVVKSKRVAIAAGVALFLIGSWFLYQAWDARGEKPPRLARPFVWW
jgi:hypothetical protein